MVNPKDLLRRAQASDDGEAYATAARSPGYRIGVGARTARKPPAVFVEVILDLFPERPQVVPEHLENQAEAVRSLQAHGYAVTCDDDGTITCERATPPNGVSDEIRRVKRLLGSAGRTRPRG